MSVDFHRSNNQGTRHLSEAYTPHRLLMMKVLKDMILKDSKSVAFIGPGNCNDLDIPEILNRFNNVIMIDPDNEALEYGLSRYDTKIITRSALAVEDFASGLDRPIVDVVVSCCVLSQICALIGKNKEQQDSTCIKHFVSLCSLAIKQVIIITDFCELDRNYQGAGVYPNGDFSVLPDSTKYFSGLLPHNVMKLWMHHGSLLREFLLHDVFHIWEWQQGSKLLGVFAVDATRRG